MRIVDFEPRAKLKKGLDTVANAVKLTIGPKGRNVVIGQFEPIISNDGGTIAQQIELKDKVENIGAQLIKDIIRKTSETVGGGRTASAILTQAIVTEGFKQIETGANMSEIKKGMKEAVLDITTNLKKHARKVSSKEQLRQIATISTESEELGLKISEVINKVGKDCVVTVEDSQTFGVTSEIQSGLKIDRGYISPYMVTNPQRMEAEYTDVSVLVTDKKITIFKEIFPIVQKLVDQGKNSLVIFCEDLEGDALNNVVMMKLKNAFNVLAVKQNNQEWLENIALSTGTQIVSDKTGVKFDVELGKAKKVVANKEFTVLMGKELKTKITDLKAKMLLTEDKFEQDKLSKRIAVLSGSVAVIKVGAATETEIKYLKQKIEDGVNESKRALEEGIVIGGDCAFVQAVKNLKSKQGSESSVGYNIILKAVLEPFKQIILNGNGKPDVILNEINKDKSHTLGYNALTNEVADLFQAGVIDALKVTRTVLENALSGASMFLTIEAAIIEEKEETVN